MNPLLLLAGGFQLGTSAYDAFKKKKIPSWYEDAYNQAKLLADEGLTPAQLSKMRTAYAPGMSRGLSERREREASLNASRGRTGSSYGNEQILSVPTTEETIAPMLAEADQNAMSQGRQMLMQLTGGRMQLDAENDAVTNQGLYGIGSGLMNIEEGLFPKENPLQDALINFLNGQSGGVTQEAAQPAGGLDLSNLSPEDIQALIDFLNTMNADTSLPPFQNQPAPMPE